MLIAGLGQDRCKIGWRSGSAGLEQGAVECGGVRHEQAQIACGEAGRQLEGDADIALGLLPGAEGGLDLDGVAGVDDIAGDQARLHERDLNAPGNSLDVEIDLADHALARAVRVEARESLAGKKGELAGARASRLRPRPKDQAARAESPQTSMLPVRW